MHAADSSGMSQPNLEILTPPAGTDIDQFAAQYHAEVLLKAVAEHTTVLLMLSGGSAIEMYGKMLSLIPPEVSFNNLEVVMIDERYGTYGHPDSNEQQLRAKGIVDELEKRGANFNGMLSVQNFTPEETVKEAAYRYQNSLNAEYVLVFAGIGDDGHTAGWLPTRNEDRFNHLYNHKEPVVYYEVDPLDSDNQYKQRLTISTMVRMDKVVVFAKGEKKVPALQRVKQGVGQFHETPALQLLKAREGLVILTDQKVE